MDKKRLQSLALFTDLSKKELERLSQVVDTVEVPAGKQLAGEGDFAYEFFVIEQGTATVTKEGDFVRELGPGDFFGEIGLLETEKRTATVVAKTPMVLGVVAWWDLKTVEKNFPEVGRRIRERIGQRLTHDLQE